MSTHPLAPPQIARRAGAVAIALLMVVVVAASPARADHGDDDAARAAAAIQAARDEANAAAQAMFDAESLIDSLAVEIDDAERHLRAVEARADSMRVELEQQAIRSFVRSGTSDFPLLIDVQEANAEGTATLLSSVSRSTANVDLDDYDAVISDVEDARRDLGDRRREAEAARTAFADSIAAAEAQVEQLAEVERQRLTDEAVEHELARRRQERAAAADAQAAAVEAAAVTPIAAPPTTSA
ncbi:MAG: hypothetical protein HKN44_06055, partial [Ilumatobacter sp.]|nr:hypothetical protein [Ilumatobacter sp.]